MSLLNSPVPWLTSLIWQDKLRSEIYFTNAVVTFSRPTLISMLWQPTLTNFTKVLAPKAKDTICANASPLIW